MSPSGREAGRAGRAGAGPRPVSLALERRLGTPLPAAFFRRGALAVAPELLGLVLAHATDDGVAAGRIVEVEAYCGPADRAAHSAGGRRTARNEVMYGPAGHAYVYFIYGMHHCVNVVVASPGVPEAVLIRALEPLAGLDVMRARRGSAVPDLALARGPGNVTQALGIARMHNGADLRSGPLRLLRPPAPLPPPADVVRSPRIGVAYAGAWASRPWRFSVRGSRAVSRPVPR